MNLKRHHVLYILLAVSLMVALIVFLVPSQPEVSYTQPSAAAYVASTAPPAHMAAMKFEIVTTLAAQERGLGGRTDIPHDYGMLFVFPSDQRIGFWMKDMLTSIDMIWVSDTGTILGIEDNVSPDTYPKSFYPPKPVKYVLETRAGEARKLGWEVGTQLHLPLP